ncbi:hypothetical protein VOLCADRAFT_87803 [Volvox carteri f. nagariensis]|uniref:Uncharacterized protein n=1 Tax=Volvox carteri f. nagariensis TaxID=3068 RepID=D8TMA4_VOLCA|nr:uncharacterized protein VOLCADRAFT_87803 [Volvox carteri f. nagariensis]EFJ51469.1 hypothetical protein VOLCADRAFT_87803 [Volvox carteri f. nagariensis]|eukprot:XP_002947421.1 hypothetical protein VOLCADRAFT_87803 [Volvox carteri f. nagariensis]
MLRKVKLAHQLHQACQAAALDAYREGSSGLASWLPARCNGNVGARCASTSAGPSGSHQAPAAAAASTASTSGSEGETPLSVFSRQSQNLAAMPLYPKLLGFAGAIPFTTLTPAFVQTAGLPDLVDYCAQMQLVYGGSIVSFLGAVHWGLAMSSSTMAAGGSRAAGALNERYVWSVVPSLGVVPALMMPPAQGSLAIAVLLGICYISDAAYYRSGYLPSWYMSLRGYLTLLALCSMLATTGHYLKRDVERAKKLMEEEDAKRAARLEARAAEASAAAAAAVASSAAAPPAAVAQGRGRK